MKSQESLTGNDNLVQNEQEQEDGVDSMTDEEQHEPEATAAPSHTAYNESSSRAAIIDSHPSSSIFANSSDESDDDKKTQAAPEQDGRLQEQQQNDDSGTDPKDADAKRSRRLAMNRESARRRRKRQRDLITDLQETHLELTSENRLIGRENEELILNRDRLVAQLAGDQGAGQGTADGVAVSRPEVGALADSGSAIPGLSPNASTAALLTRQPPLGLLADTTSTPPRSSIFSRQELAELQILREAGNMNRSQETAGILPPSVARTTRNALLGRATLPAASTTMAHLLSGERGAAPITAADAVATLSGAAERRLVLENQARRRQQRELALGNPFGNPLGALDAHEEFAHRQRRKLRELIRREYRESSGKMGTRRPPPAAGKSSGYDFLQRQQQAARVRMTEAMHRERQTTASATSPTSQERHQPSPTSSIRRRSTPDGGEGTLRREQQQESHEEGESPADELLRRQKEARLNAANRSERPRTEAAKGVGSQGCEPSSTSTNARSEVRDSPKDDRVRDGQSQPQQGLPEAYSSSAALEEKEADLGKGDT